MKSTTETEVKIVLHDRSAIEGRLSAAGFHVAVPRLFEANSVYDTPDTSLRAKGMLLRLREVGDKAVLTWKGPGTPGRHKSRPELETTLGSAETFRQMLAQLGYQLHFRYEKYRVEYGNDTQPDGTVTVDETPIGDFLEIEGPADWIDATASRLGFSEREYRTESYGQLYLDHCRQHGLQPSHMLFASVDTTGREAHGQDRP